MSKPVALELRSVAHHFGNVVALEDAVLSATKGTVHALLGENGAGKTTLMRVAYGLLRPTRGDVLVHGTPQAFDSPAGAIAAGVAMVQQHPANVGALTVWENVLLGGSGRIQPRQARAMVRSTAERLGFNLDVDARVADLPVASQQRLEIVKAASHNATILILDEPTAILAPEEARELYAWLRNFANEGGTAIVVTHKLDEARRFTDDLTVLRAGRTVLTATSATISVEDLTAAMIGGGDVVAPPPRPKREASSVVFRANGLSLRDARNVVVVRGANVEVRAGEIVGVAGVEGSGHHELLLAIAGRHSVADGHVSGPASASIIPEDRHLNGVALDFTLTENVAIRDAGVRKGAMQWSERARSVSELLGRFDVRARGPEDPMRSLSGGNQQKVVLARELDAEPALVVAENPTRGLDIRAAAFVREQLRAARDRGAGIVLYSSDLDEIIELADRVLVVHAGAVAEVPRDRNRIGAAMLGAA